MESFIVAMVPAPAALRQHLREVHGPEVEQALFNALVHDALDTARIFAASSHASDNNRKISLVVNTASAEAAREPCRESGYHLNVIENSTWSEGLTAVLESEFDRGARSVGLLSGLAPSAPPHLLSLAFRALMFHPMVAGPDLSGHAYFLGLQRPLPDFFASLDWDPMPEISQILGAQTRPQAVHLLPFWTQLDSAQGLSWFASHTSYRDAVHTAGSCQATAALLRRHAAWGTTTEKTPAS